MKAVICAVILCLALATMVAAADAPKKVTIDAKSMQLKDAVDEISKQTGASIVLDPKAQGTLTASLNDADLGQVLDVLTKANKLTWKKLQFARQEGSKIQLDSLKSSILALATLPVMGLSVEDPATKTSTVFAKNLPASPDTTALGLPEGYSWTTVYVVLAPELVASAATQNKVQDMSQAQAQRMVDLANMTPEDRKQVFQSEWMARLGLAPEARQALMRDQMDAMRSLDPQYRQQLHDDMRSVFRGMRGPGNGQFRGQGQGGHQNHGN